MGVRAISAVCAVAHFVCAVSTAAVALPRSDTLDLVRARGHVVCGVQHHETGFAVRDEAGRWSGIETDFCAALAAAVFGRKDAVTYRLLPPSQRIASLKAGEIDVLTAQTAWTMTRDVALGVRFATTLLYDGLAMLVRRKQGLASTLELSGTSVCALDGHGGAQAVRDYFAERRMRLRSLVTSDSWDTLVKAYQAGQCVALAGDSSALARSRIAFKDADEHTMLPERLGLEPLGVMVAEGHAHWFSVVRWTMMALIAAEEAGLTMTTVAAINPAAAPLATRRLLGMEGHLGADLGLPRHWVRKVVEQVGNYGEMYERNLGMGSSLKLPRGLNAIWTKGGLMASAPFR